MHCKVKLNMLYSRLMIVGVLLAGGKGSRFKAKATNKTATLFNSKPLIQYGVDIYNNLVNKTYVVVGAYKNSVMNALTCTENIVFVEQRKRLGTGHALKLVLKELKRNNLKPNAVLVGNGDHMMFYDQKIIKKIIETHILNSFDITFITTLQKNPTGLGRVIRNKKDEVLKIIEEKDANEYEKKIKEINAGFYCFTYQFLEENFQKLTKSEVSGEYYITEFIKLAIEQNKKVYAYKVPFKYVGYGINTQDDFKNSLNLYEKNNSNNSFL